MTTFKGVASINADLKRLRELVPVLRVAARSADAAAPSHLSAMADILDKLESGEQEFLTDKQHTYVKNTYNEYHHKPAYRDLWGKELEVKRSITPTVLKLENLPKKPPGRGSAA